MWAGIRVQFAHRMLEPRVLKADIGYTIGENLTGDIMCRVTDPHSMHRRIYDTLRKKAGPKPSSTGAHGASPPRAPRYRPDTALLARGGLIFSELVNPEQVAGKFHPSAFQVIRSTRVSLKEP
jgi:hypothetical protein